jgi:hypothetical protein
MDADLGKARTVWFVVVLPFGVPGVGKAIGVLQGRYGWKL